MNANETSNVISFEEAALAAVIDGDIEEDAIFIEAGIGDLENIAS